MPFTFFDTWSADDLKAFATVISMFALVGTILFVLREKSSASNVMAPSKKEKGKYGFSPSAGERLEVKVLQIRSLSPTIKSFRLQPPDGTYVDYAPGQFLTFHLGENHKLSRCYSLNSAPSRPGLYEVSVKRLEGGQGSSWMHDRVKVGDTLKITNPSGRLTFQQEGQCSVFVAGGIGITPVISMLRYAVDTGDPRPLYFFYAAQNENELVFYDELKILAARAPNVHLLPILSNPGSEWQGESGRINADMMLKTGLNFKDAELYTCGPAAMMDAVKKIALDHGMPAERFHSEVFSSPASQKQPRRQCQIHLNQSQKTLAYDDTIPLLDFLEKNQVPMSFSCRAGVCGTCEITVSQGKVHQLPSDFLSQDDLQEGRRLSCISYPEEDLKIDL